MDTIFRFKISLRGSMCEDFPASYCTRIIEISGDSSLEALADAVLYVYDFEMDHAFGFYNVLTNYFNSTESYSLFADLDVDDPIDSKSVVKTKICDVFEKNKKMLFLFDYGDEWIFHIRCLSIGSEQKGKNYPALIQSKGKSPEQYPEYDE